MIAEKLLSKLSNTSPLIDSLGEMVVNDLQQNILNEGGDPVTGESWQALAQSTIDRKRQIGAFLTILRQFDKLRQGIKVVRKDGTSFNIGVTGEARQYFYFHQLGLGVPQRRFLGFSQEARNKIKQGIAAYLKA